MSMPRFGVMDVAEAAIRETVLDCIAAAQLLLLASLRRRSAGGVRVYGDAQMDCGLVRLFPDTAGFIPAGSPAVV